MMLSHVGSAIDGGAVAPEGIHLLLCSSMQGSKLRRSSCHVVMRCPNVI